MTDIEASTELPLSSRAAVLAGGIALRVLANTWRYHVVGGESLERLRANNVPFIFSLWHGQLLPLIWRHHGEHVAILVSEHRDGELIARLAKSIGYRLIRGSSSRGGERALLALAKELREGREVAVTPDGPRGPARSYAPGALIAAQRTGAPILPIAAHADSAWRLSSWDSFMIPKPFAKVTIAYGEPTRVSVGSSRDAAAEAPEFQKLMEETERRACG
ncbi:MAG: lysophospholipid acyltransferase family protein [Gemmatimonadaceae bacterium]